MQGFVVGSITGTCRFYGASGNDLQLEAEIHVQGRKKTSGNRITGIQVILEGLVLKKVKLTIVCSLLTSGVYPSCSFLRKVLKEF